MKVWVLVEYVIRQSAHKTVVGVFSSEQKARDWLEASNHPHYELEEWEVDGDRVGAQWFGLLP